MVGFKHEHMKLLAGFVDGGEDFVMGICSTGSPWKTA